MIKYIVKAFGVEIFVTRMEFRRLNKEFPKSEIYLLKSGDYLLQIIPN